MKPSKTMTTTMLVAVAFLQFASAANHTVGGSSGWDLSSNLSQWSASETFLINDSLVFNYTPAHDVVELSESDFSNCQISSAVAAYSDGFTVIPLTTPGFRYFVCGRSNHCETGLKLSVMVQDLPSPSNTTEPSPNDGTHNIDHHHRNGNIRMAGFNLAVCYLLCLSVSVMVLLF